MRTVKEIEKLLDEYLKGYMEKQKIPGISIGIVLEGALASTKSYGVRNIENGVPVEAQSLFHSASISKTFVVTALMQLYEKGLLDINKPVTAYLPYFKLKDERYKLITVQQMMSHTSGMPDVYDYEWEEPQYGDDALENYVRSVYDIELLWDPGTSYSYSNLAYEMLGDVIAKTSGTTFENYVKQNILDPLGMKESSFLIQEADKGKMTSPHVLSLEQGVKAEVCKFYPYNRIHGPSSTLWSNVEELSRYAIANLNKGSFEGWHMLKKESYERMWQPIARTNAKGTHVGLSWFQSSYKGVELVFHTGGDTGYSSNLVLMPNLRAALVLYCNCDFGNLLMLTEQILDIMLDFEVKPLLCSGMMKLAEAMAKEGIAAAKAVFEDIVRFEKTEYYIGEAEFNRLAYHCLRKRKLDEAVEVLKMAISELPEAANLYDSLGEMYLEKGEQELAIANYRRALELNPHCTSSITALRKMGIEV